MEKVKRREEFALLTNLMKNRGAERVCDIGCGAGEMVEFLNKSGIEAFGFDIKIESPKSDRIVISSAKKPGMKLKYFDTFLFKQSMHHIDKDFQEKLIESLAFEKGRKIFIVEATIGEGNYDKIKSLVFPEREMRLSVLETLHKIRSKFSVRKIKTYGKVIEYGDFEEFYRETIASNPKTVWNKEIEKAVKPIFEKYKRDLYQQMDVYLVEKR